MQTKILTVGGAEAAGYLPAVASLRIRVFREYPYLYDGDEEHEREYLERYSASPGSVLVLATAGVEVVGASSGLPLTEAGDDFLAPWVGAGHEVARVFYLGESVLLGPFRGRGLGHEFFAAREGHAAALGFSETAFCAVDRPADHPLRPEGYWVLNEFWQKRGYIREPGLVARVGWKQVDGPGEVENTLTFWRRRG